MAIDTNDAAYGEQLLNLFRHFKTSVRRTSPLDPQTFASPPIPDESLFGAIPVKNSASLSRDSRLPIWYYVDSHPLRPAELQGLGKDYVYGIYSCDGDFACALSKACSTQSLFIPKGPDEEMDDEGLYELKEGDMVWVRDLDAPDIVPEKDCLQIYVLHPEEYGNEWPQIKKKIDTLRDDALGPREERTCDHVRFEDSSQAKGVKGARCYTLGISFQRARNLATPNLGGKLSRGEELSAMDEGHLKLRERLIKDIVPFAVEGFKRRCPHLYKVLEDAAELFNTPRIGVHANVAYSNAQQNLATPQLFAYKGTMSEMGHFQFQHNDEGDAATNYSNMTSNSDLPEGYQGGRFHFVELGCYLKLNGLKAVGFSGLRWHSGTPPLAPPSVKSIEDIEPWAYRWVHILYLQSGVIEGSASFNVAAAVGNSDVEAIQLTSNMRSLNEDPPTQDGHTSSFLMNAQSSVDPRCDYPVFSAPYLDSKFNSAVATIHTTSHLNFAGDGVLMMEPWDLLDFISRSLYFQTLLVHRQLGRNVTADYERARTVYTVDGQTPRSWALAPLGVAWTEPTLDMEWSDMNARQRAYLVMKMQRAFMSRFIPARHSHFAELLKSHKCGYMSHGNNNVNAVNTVSDLQLKNTVGKRKGTSAKANRKKWGSKSHGSRTSKAKKAKPDIITNIQLVHTAKEKAAYVALTQVEPPDIVMNGSALSIASSKGKRKDLHPSSSNSNGRPFKRLRFASSSGSEDNEDNEDNENNEADENERNEEEEEDNECPSECGDEVDGDWVDDQDASIVSLLSAVDTSSCKQAGSSKLQFKSSPFLDKLQSDSLHRACNILNSALQSPRLVTQNYRIAELVNVCNQLKSQPHVKRSALLVMDIYKKLEDGTLLAETHYAQTMLYRHALLCCHHAIASWICMCLAPVPETSWLHTLIQDIDSHLQELPKGHTSFSLTLHSKSYLPDLPEERSATFTLHKKVSQGNRNSIRHSIILFMVYKWMDIPPLDVCRADFLVTVERNLSSTAFLLDGVWEVYQNITLLNPNKRGRTRIPSGPIMVWFAEQMNSHVLARAGEFKLQWQELDTLRRSFLALEYSSDVPLPHKSIASVHSPSASSTIPIVHSSSTLSITSTPSLTLSMEYLGTSGFTIAGAVAFVQFLRASIPLIMDHSSGPSSLSSPSSLPSSKVALAFKRLDYYLPAREKAPSRRRILGSNGPFSHNNIRSVGGLFSALMFRGVWYDTEALQTINHSFYFRDLKEWQELFGSQPRQDEKFWCNKAAYGVTDGRSVYNAAAYWEGAKVLHHYLFYQEGLANKDQSFQDVIEFISIQKNKEKGKLFPAFGPLSSYLLVVDLVYAGAVKMPSVQEVGTVVAKLNKGMAAFLQRFGCRDIKTGFIDLYQYVMSPDGLTEAERIALGFDVFVEEHGGCKYQRFYPTLRPS